MTTVIKDRWHHLKTRTRNPESWVPTSIREEQHRKLLTHSKHPQGWKVQVTCRSWQFLCPRECKTPSALTSMSTDRHDFCVRTEMSSIYVWAHFPLKTLSSELGIVFLTTCPKDLDKVIEINSWEMIPTSYILQMLAAPKLGQSPSQEKLFVTMWEENLHM